VGTVSLLRILRTVQSSMNDKDLNEKSERIDGIETHAPLTDPIIKDELFYEKKVGLQTGYRETSRRLRSSYEFRTWASRK
jgi:hypothetical protein